MPENKLPFSIQELHRATGVHRPVIYAEIMRGCLKADRIKSGGSWGNVKAWSIPATEAARWSQAYLAEQSARGKYHRGADHAQHRM
jgi:hypothetical protein